MLAALGTAILLLTQGCVAKPEDVPGRPGVWGLEPNSSTYTIPAWRTTECVPMDESLRQYCGSLRTTYARPVAHENLLRSSADNWLYEEHPGQDAIDDTSAARAGRLGMLVRLAGLLRNGETLCKRRALGYLCNYMAPECGETSQLQYANGTVMRHPITDATTEVVRRPNCFDSCVEFFDECHELGAILEAVGIKPDCRLFTFGDSEFNKHSFNHPFTRFIEHFEAYSYPVNDTSPVNLTAQYIAIDTIPNITENGWGRHEWYLNNATRQQEWQHVQQSPVSPHRIFALSDDEATARMQLKHDRYYQSVDGRRHVMTCQAVVPATASEVSGNLECPSQLVVDPEDTMCVVGCPTPVFTETQDDTLAVLSSVLGALACLCGLAVTAITLRDPKTRLFPSRLSAFFGVALFFFGLAHCIRVDPCQSELQEQTGGSSSACGFQAWLYVFSQVAMSLWWTVLALCLAFSLRTQSAYMAEVLGKKERWMHVACWGTAVLCATIPLAAGKVARNAGNSVCSIATTDGSVTLLVLLLVLPQSLALLMSFAAASFTVYTVWTHNNKMGPAGDVAKKRRRSQLRTVIRWALFLPVYLMALVTSLAVQLDRLDAAASLNGSVRDAAQCVLELYDEACGNEVECNRNELKIDDAEVEACIDGELRHNLYSFSAQVFALVAWICVALFAFSVFASRMRNLCCVRNLVGDTRTSITGTASTTRRPARTPDHGQNTTDRGDAVELAGTTSPGEP
ncbi:MAG: hypothetical protein MHM6MM_002270 [Cercozoa sp. M6MM]